ncbi:hypothetical protein [Dysgonomonas macrotermitis]|uniref:Peptide-N(4)-(N-acetyl-beta-glucosaminyl)asparagine amidase n=1 Tax=Dysgonomonas macrotermitis TaxID=1346286 RepID=A0A1M4WLB4_9BACT|nr:hypothetical protein [Dysgonomonas macrotermitis]SHE82091.1 hypothetical protein SAMN05444362_102256 [Dysgonomonas macrotermitis]
MKRVTRLFFIVLAFMVSCTDPIKQTLETAGDNRAELEAVLNHYKEKGNEQKLEAAKFLIQNMLYKYEYEGDILAKYDTILYIYQSLRKDSIYIGDPLIINQTWDSLVSKYGKIEIPKLKKKFDCRTISSEFLIKNIDLAFEAWENSPLYNPNEFKSFCEYILPYRIGTEPVEEYKERYYKDLKSIVDTATSPESIVFGFHYELSWARHFKPSLKLWDYPVELPISKIEIGHRGACRHMTTFGALVMRACGLPVTIDRAIWANRSQGHSWNVLILDDHKNLPFDALSRGRLELAYKPAKIFRRTFSLNFETFKGVDPNDIPGSFFVFDEYDVTHEYVTAHDVSVPIQIESDEYKTKKHGIVCVFDNREWRPVYWGEIKSGKMHFKNMSPDVLYIGAYFDEGHIIPATEPFLLQSDGLIKYCQPNKEQLITLNLERKFPRFKRIEEHAMGLRRMNAEGSNHREFKDSTVLFSVYDVPYHVADSLVDSAVRYRYIRLNSSTYRLANLAEVEFYGKTEKWAEEEKLTGEIIGFPPINKDNMHPYTHAMDGDLETWFEKTKGPMGWVGLDLGKGNEHIITRIRFCPRSDTNFILKGDTYELLYWNRKIWQSMGTQIAPEYNILTYKNVPSGALYLLRNHTRGKEERIFTYENNTQIWW